ncbi:MAG: hypothetical protein NWE93_12445 [Candidatus Bathyarchaeota archaeon]|nr:hypothetical protein [Candidatus Bathyarchaeota archaeon]
MRRSFRRDCRGQVIIITGLLVALLLLSTAVYVIETTKTVPKVQASTQAADLAGLETKLRCALISALANVTGGGDSSVLSANLKLLKATVLSHSYQSMVTLDWSLYGTAPYAEGLWVSWGNSSGTSSACVSFTASSQNQQGSSSMQYTVNVTTKATVGGSFLQVNEETKQVTVSVSISNEDKAALAETMSFRFLNADEWVTVDSVVVTDFGDGTYSAAFSVAGTPTNAPLSVSVSCLDQRGISVGANITCNRA